MHISELFSDASRLRIISLLITAETSLSTLAGEFNMAESAVFHELRGLCQMHVVGTRKHGRQVSSILDNNHFAKLYNVRLNHVENG